MAIELTNSQYDRLMNTYQNMRFSAQSEARAHVREIYDSIPNFSELDDELLDATRLKDSKSLAPIIKEIEAKKEALLFKYGYDKDYLKVRYNCTHCNDTGMTENGRCHCFKNMAIRLIYGDAMWTKLLEEENFDRFDMSYYESSEDKEAAIDALNKSKELCENIINNHDTETNNLLISGNTGVGKTFLCNCIAKELIENDFFVVQLSAPALFELFEKVAFTKNKSENEYSPEVKSIHYSNIFDCDLLIIDDLGTEFSNSFTISKLLDLINKRLYNHPTVISTNLDTKSIRNVYSDRLLSRIIGNYKMIRLSGSDIRFKKKKRTNSTSNK